MAKLSLTDLANLQNETTAISNINTNSAAIETAMENTLSRDGTTPNSMEADLDMNDNRILNLPAPVDDTEPARKVDISLLTGADDAIALAAAVTDAEAAQAAAEAARDKAEEWADNAEDDPVETGPDQFSAKHWSAKAEDFATVARYREVLTADKIWYVSLTGDDDTGDGTIGDPWYSVTKAFHYILSGVDCNGFAPVVQMAPGLYTVASYPGGFSPPGDLEWGGLTGPGAGIVTVGGAAIIELSEPLIGKQITGGQGIRLCSQGDANRTGDDVIIETTGDCISCLHGSHMIVSSLTLKSLGGACISATQGSTVEVGQNVVFAGAVNGAMRAENGGQIVQTGNTFISGSTGSSYIFSAGTGSLVTGLGTVNLQYNPSGPPPAAHHFSTAYVVATQSGQVNYATTIAGATTIGGSAKRYEASYGGGILGTTLLNGVGGVAGTVDASTFAWSQA